MTSGKLIITCVSDDGGQFAKEVYDYLCAKLEQQKAQFVEVSVAPDVITLHIEGEEGENQIHIDRSEDVRQEMVKSILKSFLESDPARFKGYDVIELGETFTVGRLLPPSEMEMLTCEICGFFTPYSEELYTHRMTHFGV